MIPIDRDQIIDDALDVANDEVNDAYEIWEASPVGDGWKRLMKAMRDVNTIVKFRG